MNTAEYADAITTMLVDSRRRRAILYGLGDKGISQPDPEIIMHIATYYAINDHDCNVLCSGAHLSFDLDHVDYLYNFLLYETNNGRYLP